MKCIYIYINVIIWNYVHIDTRLVWIYVLCIFISINVYINIAVKAMLDPSSDGHISVSYIEFKAFF